MPKSSGEPWTVPASGVRLHWTGFTTFILRSYEDIVRFAVFTIAPSTVATALYFIVFGNFIGKRIGEIEGFAYSLYVAPGLIIMPVVINSFSHAAFSFITAKIHRQLDEHLLSPQPGWLIVASYAAGGLIRGLLVGASVSFVALLFASLPVQHWILMPSVVLAASLAASLAGLVCGVIAKTFEQLSGLMAFIITPLGYCGGVFYSLSLLPLWAQQLSFANPVFYLVNLMRYCMLDVTDVPVVPAVAVLLASTLALFALSTVLITRGTGIKD